MNDAIKRMSVKQFRERGYLQELNRCFLHPLGLALEIVIEDDGSVRFGEVWDYQDDPEGMQFGDLDQRSVELAIAVEEIRSRIAPARRKLYDGDTVQPLPLREERTQRDTTDSDDWPTKEEG